MKLIPVLLEAVAEATGENPTSVSRDPAKLARAIAESHGRFGKPPMTVGIDVYNVEAEAWGMEVKSPHPDAVPVLGRPIFDSADELTALKPLSISESGRLPLLLEVARTLSRANPDLPFRIGLCGPYALASALVGFETLIMDMTEDGVVVSGALTHLARHQAALGRAFHDEGFAVTFYESGAAPPLISPDLYRACIAPAHRALFGACRDLAKPPVFVLGGDTASVAEDLLTLGSGGLICPAETDQHAFMEQAMKHPEVPVRMNLPGSLVQTGSIEDVEQRMAGLHRAWGLHPRAVLGTGVLPMGTDVARIRGLMDFADRLHQADGTKVS